MAEASEYSKRKENSPSTQNITSGKTIRPSHSSRGEYGTMGSKDLGRGPKTTVKSGDNVIAQGDEDQAEKWKELYQGAKGKVDDVVGAIIDWLNEDPHAIREEDVALAPKDEPMVSAEGGEIPMEMTLSQRLEVIDPHNKQEILNLQQDIGMPEQELDGVYGPMTDAWLKAHLLDNGLEMTDAARFNLGLNEFSESPANHAYREHLKMLEEERRIKNQPPSNVAPAPNTPPTEGEPWMPEGIRNMPIQQDGSGNVVEDVNNSIYDFLVTPEEMRWMGILSHYFDSPAPSAPSEPVNTDVREKEGVKNSIREGY